MRIEGIILFFQTQASKWWV